MKSLDKLRTEAKKTLISASCIAEMFIMIGSLSACGAKNDNELPQQTPAPAAESQQDTGQSEPGGNEQISLEDAKQAALADAGLSDSDVVYTKEREDYEDGIAVYDIEFYADNVEYEYEINAVTGEVYSKSVETNQMQPGRGHEGNTEAAKEYITRDSAEAAALAHAGFSAADVSRLKSEFDIDDGQAVYEIEFYKDGREYEYTINATDGSVIEYDID